MTIQSLKLYTMIGLGGMVGAVCRYGLSIPFAATNEGFPFATLTANLIGCFLLSFLLNQHVIKRELSPESFAAISTGVIGAFTTFSTVTIETVGLWNFNVFLAIGYLFISVVGGLVFCYCGFKLATRKRVTI